MNILLQLAFAFIFGLGVTSWPANEARAQAFPDCLTSALIGQNGRIEEGRVSGSS
jgi:hypothetical protein